MKAEAYPDYNTLENDKNQNWKLAFFYFAGPLFYTLIMAIIFLGAIGTFYLPYKFSGNPEYWDNLFSVYATPILLSLIVGWFICIWSSLFPLPWRRNSGFKTIVCLKRGFAKKPITSFPCVERVSEDRIWGESYIGEVVRDTGIEALKIICFILKWTVFLGITAIITGIHLGLHSDD